MSEEEAAAAGEVVWLTEHSRIDEERRVRANLVLRQLPGHRVRVEKNRTGPAGHLVSLKVAEAMAADMTALSRTEDPEHRGERIRTFKERAFIEEIGHDCLEARGSARLTLLYADKFDGDLEYDARVDVTFLGEDISDTFNGTTLEGVANAAARALARELAHEEAPGPSVGFKGAWTTLAELPKGSLFETEAGAMAVKSEYSFADGRLAQCILLGTGEYAAFREGNLTKVRAVLLDVEPNQ